MSDVDAIRHAGRTTPSGSARPGGERSGSKRPGRARAWAACAFLFGLLALLLAAPVSARQVDFTTDFETGNLAGWQAFGEAFRYQPTRGDNPTARQRGQPSNHQGDWWIGTFERYQGRRGERPGTVQGDRPTGYLQSREFTIPAGSLTFRVGGGAAFETRVELIVLSEGGDVEFRESRAFHASGRNSETMQPVTWKLDPYAGARGFIRIVDNASGPWGHINADDFRFVPRFQVMRPMEIAPAAPAVIEPVRPAGVSVPDLRGRSLRQAMEMAKEAGLSIEDVQTVEPGYREGTVIRQAPEPGTQLPRGGGVILVLGPRPRVTVPPVAGMDLENAARTLERGRLVPGEVIERESGRAAPGTVIRQDPPAGAEVAPGSAVTLVVAVAPPTVAVPDLEGLTVPEAAAALGEADLELGEARSVESTAPENRIVRQAPPRGAPVDRGTAVNVFVAVAVRVEVPRLLGRQRTEVDPILTESGLVLAGVRERVSERRTGTVLDQDPEPGVVVRAGAGVRIVVAVAPPPVAEEPPATGEPPGTEEPPFAGQPPGEGEPPVAEPPAAEEPQQPPVVGEPPAAEEPPVSEVPPPEGSRIPDGRKLVDPVWLGVLAAAVILAVLVTHLAHKRANRRRARDGRAGQAEVTFRPRPDPGMSAIGSGSAPGPDLELRLRPVRDPGTQRTDPPDDLIQNPGDEP